MMDNESKLNKIANKVFVMQIIALVLICSSGIYMTYLNLKTEQLLLIPVYCVMMYVIVKLYKKWCSQICW